MVVLISLLSCKQDKKLVFNPTENLSYQYTIITHFDKMVMHIESSFKHVNDSIYVNWLITDINYEDKADSGKIDHKFQRYVDSSARSVFNRNGKLIRNQTSLKVINPELFVIEFPDYEIKPGDSWKVLKPAKQYVFFDQVFKKYICREINEKETRIDVVMNLEEMHNGPDGSLVISKKYQGYYIVDNVNGTVIRAVMHMMCSEGDSFYTGDVVIYPIGRESF
jgi:hypothetical protein